MRSSQRKRNRATMSTENNGNNENSSENSTEPKPNDTTTTDSHANNNVSDADENCSHSFEEECVICLEELSTSPWGRCTPCNHAFHKQCWWKWENAHYERIQRQRERGLDEEVNNDPGPKCCLCNTVNAQFVDGKGEPAHNPSPFVVEDSGDGGSGGGGFFNWFRGGRSSPSRTPPRSPSGRQRGDGGRASYEEAASAARQFLEHLAGQGAAGRVEAQRFLEQFREDWGPFEPGARGNQNRNEQNSAGRGEASSGNFGGLDFSQLFEQFGQDWGARDSAARTPPRTSASASSTSASSNADTNTNPYNTIRNGTLVAIQNLVNSPQFNGRRGRIEGFASGRYVVKIEPQNGATRMSMSNNSSLAVKPENLVQLARVKIQGLVSQPQLNGMEATICSYARERNRYVVRVAQPLSSTREISVQATNLRIPDGTCVRLVGLERQPQWNNKWGTIVRWVDGRRPSGNGFGSSQQSEGGRYEVRLSRMYAVRVKMENVRI